MKKAFWKADWFLGLVIAFALFGFARMSGFIPGLERWAYDLGVKMTSKTPSDKVAVIAIDEQSIANIGRWPWPREVQAKLIDKLAAAKAKVIGNTVFFFEPQKDPGLAYVEKMLDVYNKAYGPAPGSDVAGVAPIGGQTPAATAGREAPAEVAEIGKLLNEASANLNSAVPPAASVTKAGNVIVPMVFEELTNTPPPGKPNSPLPAYAAANTIGGTPAGGLLYGNGALVPIEQVGANVAGIGHLNQTPDPADGAIRSEPLVIDYYGQQFPSLPLLVAAKSLNLGPKDVKVNPGGSVTVGGKTIRTDETGAMYTYYYKDRDGRAAFPVDSFYDVFNDKIPASKYADKIVLIGATAAGVGSRQVTPVSPDMYPVTTLAHSVSSILQEHFFVTPPWGRYATLGAYFLMALYLTLLLPRLSAGMGAGITVAILAAIFATHFGLMTTGGMWVQLMLPATLLVVGHALLTTKRYLVTERGKEKADSESAESNRMLGLAFQQQGQLDMAFDKFRKAPLNDEVMENLYNLGLDFERRRQFNKAESCFRYMATYNPKFRDIEERLNRAKTLSETIILGGSAAARSNASTMMLQGGGQEKPMLGRYQVEKELGKGAMGVVYAGKDPKIGRVVAIKTMALSAEFEDEELKEAKERFFREAETAGRLNHPNIVTIFDAGEEHDLCYIAMEFLKGKDLVQFTKMPNLLPPDKVLYIVERVADALGYAHTMS